MTNILFAGDFIPPDCSDAFSKDIIDLLIKSDFSIVNLEAPITNHKIPIKKTGYHHSVDPDKFICFKNGFFQAVTLSNNHIRDYGDTGVKDTLSFCQRNKIFTVGAGMNLIEASKPLKIILQNHNIIIFNFSEKEFNAATDDHAGGNIFDLITAYQQIINEKNAGNFIIVIFHGGIEYKYIPSRDLVKKMRFLIDIGADCIICHHSHRYSGIEMYKQKPIFYGLGNLLAKTRNIKSQDWKVGLIGLLKIDTNVNVELFPTIMDETFQKVSLLLGKKKDIVLAHIQSISSLIINENSFNDYWDSEFENLHNGYKLLRTLKSSNQIEYRIRKYIPFLKRSTISEFQLLNLINLIQCESHREQMISILNNIYKNKFENVDFD